MTQHWEMTERPEVQAKPSKSKTSERIWSLRRQIAHLEHAILNADSMSRDWAAAGSVRWQLATEEKGRMYRAQLAEARLAVAQLEASQ